MPLPKETLEKLNEVYKYSALLDNTLQELASKLENDTEGVLSVCLLPSTCTCAQLFHKAESGSKALEVLKDIADNGHIYKKWDDEDSISYKLCINNHMVSIVLNKKDL